MADAPNVRRFFLKIPLNTTRNKIVFFDEIKGGNGHLCHPNAAEQKKQMFFVVSNNVDIEQHCVFCCHKICLLFFVCAQNNFVFKKHAALGF